MLSAGRTVRRSARRWSLRAREEVDVQGIIESLRSLPAAQQTDRFPERGHRGAVKGSDTIKCDADAGFYLEWKFKKQHNDSYRVVVQNRNQMYRLIARFRRQGLAGEEVFTVGIKYFAQLTMGARAHAIFDMALEDGVRPNSRMYGHLLTAYGKSGDWKMVHHLLSQMLRNQVTPTTGDFNSIMRAHSRAGNKREVLEILSITNTIFPPDLLSWNVIMSNTTSCREAMLLFSDMRESGIVPETRLICSILDSCVNGGEINSAESILRLAERQWGIVPIGSTYNVMMNVYLALGDHEGVKETFSRLQREGHRPNRFSYGTLIKSSALARDTHTGRAAFIEANEFDYSGSIQINTSLTAVFGYAGDHQNAQRCWEGRPGKGPAAKRTEQQLTNIRECFVSARLGSYPQKSIGLMAENFRLRDPNMMTTGSPYILQSLVLNSVALRGWGVKPIWRMLCQARTPKSGSESSMDTRRRQKGQHITTDVILSVAIALWIKDHPVVESSLIEKIERDPWAGTGIVHLDLLEDIFARAYNRGPSMGATIISQLLSSYAAIGALNRAMVRFKKLLEGDAALRLMYPHATSMRDIYYLSKDQSSVDLCNDVITRYHNQTLWKLPSAEVLQKIAEDGSKPSDETFALIREKRTKAQTVATRKKRMAESQETVQPEGEENIIGISNKQLPLILERLNTERDIPKGSETVCYFTTLRNIVC